MGDQMAPRSPEIAVLALIGVLIAAVTCAASDAPELAYIYDTDTVARDAFGTFLWGAGFNVTTVAMSAVETHDFSAHDLIVIGRDTGSGYIWGTPAAVSNVVAADLPVVGQFAGGASFFHQLGLYMSWGHCMGGTSSALTVADPGLTLWYQPDPVFIAPDGSVTTYSSGSDGRILNMGGAPPEVTCYGRTTTYTGHCAVSSEQWAGPFVALWSLYDLPDDMTTDGRNLFSNLIWFALDAADSIFADGFEAGDATRWSATTP